MKKYLLPAILGLSLSSPLALFAEDAAAPAAAPAAAAAPVAAAPAAAAPVAAPAKPAMPAVFEEMKKEREAHMAKAKAFTEQMRAAKTPEERQKLMDEHVKSMESEIKEMENRPFPEMPPMPEFRGQKEHDQALKNMMDERAKHMQAMQEKMQKMQGMSVEEQRKAMDDQMKAMQEHMQKMHEMNTPPEAFGYQPMPYAGMDPRMNPRMDPRMDPRMGQGPMMNQQRPMGPRPMGQHMGKGPHGAFCADHDKRIEELEKKVQEMSAK